jgi:CRP-like cAMP-binding protein
VTALEPLKRVSFLSSVDDETLEEIAARARHQIFHRGARIVTELEFGSDVYVVVSGEAEVSVEPRAGERQVLGKLGPGAALGEMSALTGELRSATVTALTDTEVLVIADRDFEALRARRPAIAVALVRTLAERLAEAERSVDALLAKGPVKPPPAAKKATRGSLGRVWRELVVDRKRDLAFLTLAAFVVTLLAVRLAVYASFRWDFEPRLVLRTAYMTGFTLLGVSACASLLTFRPAWRRAIAVLYGVGVALILNELGVTLAFDIFYKDIHTADPNVPFDIERLYRRTEPHRAVVIGLVVLVQAAYLRRFYRRAWFVIATRLRKLVTS